jgi:hypothetical protein
MIYTYHHNVRVKFFQYFCVLTILFTIKTSLNNGAGIIKKRGYTR